MFPFIYNNTGITDDKVLHFIISIGISIFLYYFFVLRNKNTLTQYTIKTIVILAVISILKEVRDYFTPGHNVEILDIVTNYIGFFCFYSYLKIKEFLILESSSGKKDKI